MYSPASGGEIMLQEFVEQVEKNSTVSNGRDAHCNTRKNNLRSMQEQALLL